MKKRRVRTENTGSKSIERIRDMLQAKMSLQNIDSFPEKSITFN